MPKISCVKLFKRIKINEKWILAQALFDSKGRLRRDHVRVQEKDEIHPEGSYFIEWWDRGKVTAKRSGRMAFRPPTRPERSRPNSPPFATEFSPHPLFRPPELERTTVAEAIERYSEYIKYHRSLRTFRTYRPILASFKSFCTRSYIDDVDRDDLLAFATYCMKQGQKGKSVYNKLVVLSQVLKQHGKPKVLNTADWPSFVETVRPIYEDSDLTKLFKTCTPTEEARFKFYLMSGFRDAEGRFVSGRDVDFKHAAVRVTAKPHWGFHPKNWEEREIPVPQKLIALLQSFRPAKAAPDDPVFPSSSGRPDGAMLEKLKAVARRGKLNCGHCAISHKLKDGTVRINRCADGPFCGRWFLHKFRHTYATRHLQDGIDIRTLQQWMGHPDIASTMVYLKGVRNSDIQVRLNKGGLAAFA